MDNCFHEYWTHNTAYHEYILKRAAGRTNIRDVGCGDGQLAQRLSHVCNRVTGIDPDAASIINAKLRLKGTGNATVYNIGFEEYEADGELFDMIIFAASMHHMDHEFCLRKAKRLLIRGGLLLVIGCAKNKGAADFLFDVLRMIPARVGSAYHREKKEGAGAPVKAPETTLRNIKKSVKKELPGAKIRRGLYYRYLLNWIKL
jgi:SAM-dependent methyltransferase